LAKNERPEPASFRPGAKPRPGASPRLVALSVKQPWAALLVASVKTVEVRTWCAHRRGTVLIHAGLVADDRPEGWELITTPELTDLARLRGGIIGVGQIAACVRYRTAAQFAAAADLHRNAPDWFRPGGLYGFVFRNTRPLAYYACPGQTMFFSVDGITLS
jgi:hypothetical protein